MGNVLTTTQKVGEQYSITTNNGGPILAAVESGGGGGAVAPLSNVFFVDSETTTPLASQNGSIATPYSSVQQAVDARAVASHTHIQILLLVDNTTGYTTFTLPASSRFRIQGFHVESFGAAQFQTYGGNFLPEKVSVAGIVFGGVDIILEVFGLQIDHLDYALTDSTSILLAWACAIVNDGVPGAVSNPWVRYDNCVITGDTYFSAATSQGPVLDNCQISNCSMICAPAVDNLNPQVHATSVQAVEWDNAEYAIQWDCDPNTAALINQDVSSFGSAPAGSNTLIRNNNPAATFVVPVPVVAAGQIAYVDVLPTIDVRAWQSIQMVGWNPLEDFSPAGVGGGLINVRMYDDGGTTKFRFCLLGPLAAGNKQVLVWIAGG